MQPLTTAAASGRIDDDWWKVGKTSQSNLLAAMLLGKDKLILLRRQALHAGRLLGTLGIFLLL